MGASDAVETQRVVTHAGLTPSMAQGLKGVTSTRTGLLRGLEGELPPSDCKHASQQQPHEASSNAMLQSLVVFGVGFAAFFAASTTNKGSLPMHHWLASFAIATLLPATRLELDMEKGCSLQRCG